MTPLGDGGRARFNWRALGFLLGATSLLCLVSTKSAPHRFVNTFPSALTAPLTNVAGALGQQFRGLQILYLSNIETTG